MLNSNKLTEVGWFILKHVCQRYIEENGARTISSEDILDAARQQGLPQEDIQESLILLSQEGFLKPHYRSDRKKYPYQVHPDSLGFDTYYRGTIEDYDDLVHQVASALINMREGEGELSRIAKVVDQHKMLVDHILRDFEQRGFTKVRRADGGYAFVSQVSPTLKRALGTR